jgi:hypothetical protein
VKAIVDLESYQNFKDGHVRYQLMAIRRGMVEYRVQGGTIFLCVAHNYSV